MSQLHIVGADLDFIAGGSSGRQPASDLGNLVEVGVKSLPIRLRGGSHHLDNSSGQLRPFPDAFMQNVEVNEVSDRQFLDVSDFVGSSHVCTLLGCRKVILS
jgi:hypothetical protein